MAATASAVGSPMVNTKAANTVATRMARPKPGRFAQQFQNPGAAAAGRRQPDRSKFQNPGAGGQRPQFRNASAYPGRPGGQVPGQYQTPGRPGGGVGGPQFPGDSSWWRNTPQMPPQRQWGSPQFNWMGGNSPSAQPGGGPNWGGGGTPSWMGGMQRGGYGQGQMGGGGQVPGQYQTPGRPGGGMPQGGMPGYGGQQYQNNAYGALQDRIYNQMMMSEMPWGLREKARFEQGAAGSGYDIGQNSGQGQIFQGYGDKWGYSPNSFASGRGNETPYTRNYGASQWGGQPSYGGQQGGGFGGFGGFGGYGGMASRFGRQF